MEMRMYTDGGARGNPGPAAIGVVIKDHKNKTVLKIGKFIGKVAHIYTGVNKGVYDSSQCNFNF